MVHASNLPLNITPFTIEHAVKPVVTTTITSYYLLEDGFLDYYCVNHYC